MNLTEELKVIKKNQALAGCFKESYFNVCPINAIHERLGYPHKEELFQAHCMDLDLMSENMIQELKRIAKEAIYYERPWWKLF